MYIIIHVYIYIFMMMIYIYIRIYIYIYICMYVCIYMILFIWKRWWYVPMKIHIRWLYIYIYIHDVWQYLHLILHAIVCYIYIYTLYHIYIHDIIDISYVQYGWSVILDFKSFLVWFWDIWERTFHCTCALNYTPTHFLYYKDGPGAMQRTPGLWTNLVHDHPSVRRVYTWNWDGTGDVVRTHQAFETSKKHRLADNC